jgi:hypothetical protein
MPSPQIRQRVDKHSEWHDEPPLGIRWCGFATTIDGVDQFLILIFLQSISHSDLEKSHNVIDFFWKYFCRDRKWVRSCFFSTKRTRFGEAR